MKHIYTRIVFSFLMLISGLVWAVEPVGHVVFVKGEAIATRQGEQVSTTLAFNDQIYPLDTLETKQGELKVLLTDETVLSLGRNSKLLVTEYIYKPKNLERRSVFDIIKGKVRTIIQKTSRAFKVDEVTLQTPTAVAGIRGTDVGIIVDGKTTQFVCFEGSFDAYFRENPQTRVFVQEGMFTRIANEPPSPPMEIPPQLIQSFSSQMLPPSLNQVLDQPGAEQLNPNVEDPIVGGDLLTQPPPPGGTQESQEELNAVQKGAQDGTYFEQGGSDLTQIGDPMKDPLGGLPGSSLPPMPPPPPPAFIPGGETQTPTSAGPSGASPQPQRGPVTVPISFPEGVQQ